MKICTKCGKEYPFTLEYFPDQGGKRKGKLRSVCKECRRKYYRLHHKNNRIARNKGSRLYYLKHNDEICKKQRNNYHANPEKEQERVRQYKMNNLSKIRAYARKHNKECKDDRNAWKRNKRQTDLNYKITCNLRCRLWFALNAQSASKSNRTLDLLGCSVDFLLKHIESQFRPGMSWDNYGYYGWHLDHIKPCVCFDLTDPKQQKECFSWKNIRPLWWKDNLEKNSYYNGRTVRKNSP